MTQKEESINEKFLRSFIENIFENMPISEKVLEEDSLKSQIQDSSLERLSYFKPSIFQEFPIVQSQEIIQIPQMQFQTSQLKISQAPQPSQMQKIGPMPLSPQITPQQQTLFGKLTPILIDPSVASIECPGPDRQIILHKQGINQAFPIILSKEEIDSIMNNLSQETKIPLIQGVFKAALSNLIITAVISDFIGTRFIIEKKPIYSNRF